MKLVQTTFITVMVATMACASILTTSELSITVKKPEVKEPGLCPKWPTCPPPSNEETPPAKTA